MKIKQCPCGSNFVPFQSTDKYCSPQCAYKYGKPIKKVSDKRREQNEQYSIQRKEFLALPDNKFCPVYPKKRTTEVHHMNGRTGDRLLDQEYWLAVSREGHQWIHLNPEEAREKGWLV
jgi:hypothetical protein